MKGQNNGQLRRAEKNTTPNATVARILKEGQRVELSGTVYRSMKVATKIIPGKTMKDKDGNDVPLVLNRYQVVRESKWI
jgi:hypothetical protein